MCQVTILIRDLLFKHKEITIETPKSRVKSVKCLVEIGEKPHAAAAPNYGQKPSMWRQRRPRNREPSRQQDADACRENKAETEPDSLPNRRPGRRPEEVIIKPLRFVWHGKIVHYRTWTWHIKTTWRSWGSPGMAASC
jgi:hypothetical protein